MAAVSARRAYLNGLIPFGTTYEFKCKSRGYTAKLGPILLLMVLLLCACLIGLAGLGIIADWLESRGEKAQAGFGLTMLAFATLCDFAASMGLANHRKH